MYEELVKFLRKHAKPDSDCNNCPCYDAEHRGWGTCSEELAAKAADAIEELSKIIPHNCFCCVGCEVEPKDGQGCKTGFVLSGKRAKQYVEELSKPRWILVTQGLPEMGKEVLVSDKQKNVTIAWIVGCFSKDGASFEWACSDGWIDDQLPITYWMPLPEPPKEET